MCFTIENLPPRSRFNHRLQGGGGREREEKKEKRKHSQYSNGNLESTFVLLFVC